MAKDRVRLHVYFAGTVQGVGFRYAVRHLASRRPVTGFVRNLPDGRVELVTEGDRQEALGLLGDIEEEMRGYIDRADKTISGVTGEFASFQIRL